MQQSTLPGRASLLPAAALVLTLLWRVPSLFDPPWVNDEGTYFAVAQAMAHGYRLYADVWENKPPAIYLLYEEVYHLAGPSLIAVRLLAAAAVLGLVWFVGRIAGHFYSRCLSSGASLLTGLLFGIPFLEGTTANAEVFLALFAAAGVYFGLVRRMPAAAGLCLALAVLFKVVGAFDALALGLWFLRSDRRALWGYAGAFAGIMAVTAAVSAWAGIFPAMLRDALFYDFGYVGHANGGGIPWLAALKLITLVVAVVGLRRASFPVLWLVFTLAGALISGRVFGHYFLQAVAPAVLVLAGRRPGWFRGGAAFGKFLAPLLGGVVLSTAAGLVLARHGGGILASRLQYYANFARLASRGETYATYRNQIDDHVSRNLRIAAVLRRGPPGRILVWGNIPWVYVLSGRLPVTPYTSSLRQPEVPGETASLRRAVEGERPVQVVIVSPPAPPLGAATGALHGRYHVVATTDNAEIYARRS